MTQSSRILLLTQTVDCQQQLNLLLQQFANNRAPIDIFRWANGPAEKPLPAAPRPYTLILYELSAEADIARQIAGLPGPVLAIRPDHLPATTEPAALAAGAVDCLPLSELTPYWLQRTIARLSQQPQVQLPTTAGTASSMPAGTPPAGATAVAPADKSQRETYFVRLNDIIRTALATTNMADMLNALAKQLATLFDADGCHITLYDEDENITYPAAATGPFSEKFLKLDPVVDRQTLTQAVLDAGHVLAVTDPYNSPYLSSELAEKFPHHHTVMTLPLMTTERKLGAAIFIFSGPHEFSDAEIARGQHAAGLLSLAIAKNESLHTERQQRELAQTLQKIVGYLNQTLDQQEILERILAHLSEMIAFDSVSIMLMQSDALLENVAYRSIHHPGGDGRVSFKQLHYAQLTHIQQVIEDKAPVIIADTTVDPRWLTLDTTPKIRSWLGVPLKAQDRVIGLLNMSKGQPNFFNQQHAQICQSLAEHAVVAIENARLYAATRRQLEELKILHALAEAGSAALSEDDFISQVTAVIHERLHPCHFGVLIYNPDTNTLSPHPSYRFHNPDNARREPVSATQGIAGEVLRTGRPQLLHDVTAHKQYLPAEAGMRSELCVPLRVNNRTIGIINAEHPEPNHYTEANLRLLMTLAGQTATTIEKTRLRAAESARRHEAEQLREATTALTSSLELDEVLTTILTQLQKVVAYDSAAVFLEEDHLLRIVAGRGFPDMSIVIGRCFPNDDMGLFHKLKATKQPLCIHDVSSLDIFDAWGDTDYVRGWLGVPLIVRDETIGYLTLDNRTVGAYDDSDASLAMAFGNQAATAIANARSFTAEQQARQVSETIRAANLAISRNLDLQAILDTLLEHLHLLLPYTSASIYLINDKNEAVLTSGYGYQSEDLNFVTFPLGTDDVNTYARIYHTQQHMILDDVTQWENWTTHTGTTYIRSWMGLPLQVHGRIIGFFSIDHETPGYFNEAHVKLLAPLVTHASFAIQNAQLYNSVTNQARELKVARDILTRLNSTVTVTEIFVDLHKLLVDITACDWVTVLLINPDQESGLLLYPSQRPSNMSDGIIVNLKETAAYSNSIAGKIHDTPELAQENKLPSDRHLYQLGIRSRLNLPLVVGDMPIGSLNLGWRQANSSSRAPLSLLNQITHALALGIDRNQLFEKISHRAHQLALLHNLSKQIAGTLDSTALAELVVQELCRNFRYESASIMRLDTESNHLVGIAISGPNPNLVIGYRQHISQGLAGKAVRSGQVIVANNTSSNPEFLPSVRLDIQAEIVLPLKTGERIIGVIDIASVRKNTFDDNDVALLTILGDQVAVAFEKARLFEETQQRADELAILATISATLRKAATVTDITTVILDKTASYAQIDQAAFVLYQPDISRWTLRRTYPKDASAVDWDALITAESGTHFAHIPDIHKPVRAETSLRKVNLTSQNKIVGTILLALKPNTAVTDQARRLFTAVSDIAGNALDRALVLETLEERVADRTRDLAAANERLQELDRLKSKFVSEVSHELRTPVTNLGLYLDLLAQGGEDKREQYTAVLHRQVKRLNQLIADILNLSRLEMGQSTIAMAPVDLNEIIEPILTAHQPRFDITEVELQTDLAPDLPLVWGEPNQLAQVTVNLLANSLNYTQEGWVRISTTFDSVRQQVALQIADSGIGISAEDHIHLFDRFYRGKNVSQLNIPGTGLGLAIVQEIVKLHNGDIDVESTSGQGTTFTIWLPLAPATDQ